MELMILIFVIYQLGDVKENVVKKSLVTAFIILNLCATPKNYYQYLVQNIFFI
jgi:hypothetical protein